MSEMESGYVTPDQEEDTLRSQLQLMSQKLKALEGLLDQKEAKKINLLTASAKKVKEGSTRVAKEDGLSETEKEMQRMLRKAKFRECEKLFLEYPLRLEVDRPFLALPFLDLLVHLTTVGKLTMIQLVDQFGAYAQFANSWVKVNKVKFQEQEFGEAENWDVDRWLYFFGLFLYSKVETPTDLYKFWFEKGVLRYIENVHRTKIPVMPPSTLVGFLPHEKFALMEKSDTEFFTFRSKLLDLFPTSYKAHLRQENEVEALLTKFEESFLVDEDVKNYVKTARNRGEARVSSTKFVGEKEKPKREAVEVDKTKMRLFADRYQKKTCIICGEKDHPAHHCPKATFSDKEATKTFFSKKKKDEAFRKEYNLSTMRVGETMVSMPEAFPSVQIEVEGINSKIFPCLFDSGFIEKTNAQEEDTVDALLSEHEAERMFPGKLMELEEAVYVEGVACRKTLKARIVMTFRGGLKKGYKVNVLIEPNHFGKDFLILSRGFLFKSGLVYTWPEVVDFTHNFNVSSMVLNTTNSNELGEATFDQRIEAAINPELDRYPAVKKDIIEVLKSFPDVMEEGEELVHAGQTPYLDGKPFVPKLKEGMKYPSSTFTNTYVNPKLVELFEKKIMKGEEELVKPTDNHVRSFLVPKKQPGTFRVVDDFSKVNEVLEDVPYSGPSMLEQLQQMAYQLEEHQMVNQQQGFDSRVQGTFQFDGKKAFHQIMMDDVDELTVRRLGTLYLKAKYLLMGLKMAPNVLARSWREKFQELSFNKNLFMYADNLAGVYPMQELPARLREFLECCRSSNIKLRIDKEMRIGYPELRHVGFVISAGKYEKDKIYSQLLVNSTFPKTYRELEYLVHLGSYVSSNVYGLAEPLTLLRRHIPSYQDTDRKKKLNVAVQEADEQLKEAWEKVRTLAAKQLKNSVPIPGALMFIQVDASELAMGAILLQTTKATKFSGNIEDLPFLGLEMVALFSHTWSSSQSNYHAGQKELLGALLAVRSFKKYAVLASQLIILTDHKSNVGKIPEEEGVLFKRKLAWIAEIQELGGELVYLPGRLQIVGDYISRQLHLTVRNVTRSMKKLAEADLDSTPAPTLLGRLLNLTDVSVKPHPEATLREGLWKFHHPEHGLEVIVTPANPEIRTAIIAQSHCGIWAHPTAEVTTRLVERRFYWESLDKDVQDFVQACLVCNIARSRKFKVPLGELKRSAQKMEYIMFDFADMPLSLTGNNSVLVVIEVFSGFKLIFPCSDKTGRTAALCLLKVFIWWKIVPHLYSDQPPSFREGVMKELAKKLKLEHEFSFPNISHTNGVAERAIKEVREVLRRVCTEQRINSNQWEESLLLVQFGLNNVPHPKTGLSSAEVLHGVVCENPVFFKFPSNMEQVQVVPLTKELRESFIEGNIMVQTAVDQLCSDFKLKKLDDQRKNLNRGARGFLEVGDTVLMTQGEPNWSSVGMVISKRNNWVYLVRDWRSSVEKEFHLSQLCLFKIDLQGAPLEGVKLIQWMAAERHGICNLEKLRWGENKELQVQVAWLDPSKPKTWEKVKDLVQKVPDLFRDFVKEGGSSDKGLVDAVRKLIPPVASLKF